MLDYERLDSYQCAVRFAALSFEMLESLPRGNTELGDQLRRATTSIPLNIAEGSGKVTLADRRRFNAIARGSAMECAAILEILRMQRAVDEARSKEAKDLLVRLVSMLSKMSRP